MIAKNTQDLISSLSDEDKLNLKNYVQKGIQDDLDKMQPGHSSVSPEIIQKINGLTNEFLDKHFHDDYQHIVQLEKKEIETQIGEVINQALSNYPDSKQVSAVDKGGSLIIDTPLINQEMPPIQRNELINSDEMNKSENIVLGENISFEDKHDTFNHFWGLQSTFYKFMAKFDDYVAYNILILNIWIGGIVAGLGLWSIYTNQSAKSSAIQLFAQKQDIYISGLLQSCQNIKFKTIQEFQKCVTNQQDQIISYHNGEILFYGIATVLGLCWVGMFLFLKTNYMGQNYYQELVKDLEGVK